MPTIKLYELSRGGDGVVKWVAPDGNTYQIDVTGQRPAPGRWDFTPATGGGKAMAWKPGLYPGEDGWLAVSLHGSSSIIATLLHSEDDIPRKYYFATDGGNNIREALDGRKGFVLRCEGVSECPVERFANLRVMVVVP